MADSKDIHKSLDEVNGTDTPDQKKQNEQSANILAPAVERAEVLEYASQYAKAQKRQYEAEAKINEKYGDNVLDYDKAGNVVVKIPNKDGSVGGLVSVDSSDKLVQELNQAFHERNKLESAIIGSIAFTAAGTDGKVDTTALVVAARDLEKLEAGGKLEQYHKKFEDMGKESKGQDGAMRDGPPNAMQVALEQYKNTPAGTGGGDSFSLPQGTTRSTERGGGRV